MATLPPALSTSAALRTDSSSGTTTGRDGGAALEGTILNSCVGAE
jgi:hypothetical protein